MKKQVGFPVVLLDSKLYPFTESESTSVIEFWKSTRKMIAASRTTYEKLSGCSLGSELSLAQFDDDDLTEPPHKRSKVEDVKLGELDKKLDSVLEKLTFINDLKRVFECVVCRSPFKLPVVSPCCQRIIGCKEYGWRHILTALYALCQDT